jgi:DNA-binding transcriptional ArsR family regulator
MSADEAVSVVLGANAPIVRRCIGSTAWCALELLAQSSDATIEQGAATVDASVRSVALGLGVSKNTAQRALRALRAAHLVEPLQRRTEFGKFDAAAYRLTIPAGVLSSEPRPMQSPPRDSSGRLRPARKPAAAGQLGQQLVLLPSD